MLPMATVITRVGERVRSMGEHISISLLATFQFIQFNPIQSNSCVNVSVILCVDLTQPSRVCHQTLAKQCRLGTQWTDLEQMPHSLSIPSTPKLGAFQYSNMASEHVGMTCYAVPHPEARGFA